MLIKNVDVLTFIMKNYSILNIPVKCDDQTARDYFYNTKFKLNEFDYKNNYEYTKNLNILTNCLKLRE